MTSIVKKSLYFILGFCLILPMINNSAVASSHNRTIYTQLTDSTQDCVSGKRVTSKQRDNLRYLLNQSPYRMGGSMLPSNISCKPSVFFKGTLTPKNTCTDTTCSTYSFRRADGKNLGHHDVAQLNNIIGRAGIKVMTYSGDRPQCTLYCGP